METGLFSYFFRVFSRLDAFKLYTHIHTPMVCSYILISIAVLLKEEKSFVRYSVASVSSLGRRCRLFPIMFIIIIAVISSMCTCSCAPCHCIASTATHFCQLSYDSLRFHWKIKKIDENKKTKTKIQIAALKPWWWWWWWWCCCRAGIVVLVVVTHFIRWELLLFFFCIRLFTVD